MAKIITIDIDRLIPHEKVDLNKIKEMEELYKNGQKFEPILVTSFHDKYIILDGHHRVNIFSQFQNEIDAILVEDYFAPNVHVFNRSESIFSSIITKQEVMLRAISGQLFPPKTTKHVVI